MTQLVEVTTKDGVGYVCLTRPDKRNAINHALVDQFETAVDGLIAEGVRIAVLSAQPPVFCAGADVNEALGDPGIPGTERLMARLLSDPLLWIAQVEGPALGAGVAMVAACPIAICAETATLSLPELRIGLFPAGVVAYLEPLIGTRSALTLGLSGEDLSASAAVDLGLITESVPSESVADRVGWWTQHLADHDVIIDSARQAWQSLYTRPHIADAKTELDLLLKSAHDTQ